MSFWEFIFSVIVIIVVIHSIYRMIKIGFLMQQAIIDLGEEKNKYLIESIRKYYFRLGTIQVIKIAIGIFILGLLGAAK